MSQPVTGPVGVVAVGDLKITVTPLGMAGERALDRLLAKGAEESAADHFSKPRMKKLLGAMQGTPAYSEAVREITRQTIGPVSAAQIGEYRDSPAGVALELFHRGRKATEGLTLAGLVAVITEANVDDVLMQLDALWAAARPNPATPSA